MTRSRNVALVLIDDDGNVLGVTPPIEIAMPWWQEAGPIVDALPGSTVLRLLTATPDDHAPMGGDVTYLVQVPHPDLVSQAGLTVQPWVGTLDDHELRQPWARPGGPAADLEWVSTVVEVTGPARQHRTWNLSAIWSIPTVGGDVWLKCIPTFFGHEGAALDLLSDLPIPRLIATEGHRILMAAMQGEDGHAASETEQLAMVESLVRIQAASISRVPDLLAAGVPDLRAEALHRELSSLIARVAPGNDALNRLIDEIPERMARVAQCGLPDALAHGDPHGGNCRREVTPPVWFDWGDSFVGNPLMDVAALHRMPESVVARWLDLWSEAVPGSTPHTAWEQLKPLAALRMAWVYQRFLDNIEPSEHIYHRDDVPTALRTTEQLLESS